MSELNNNEIKVIDEKYQKYVENERSSIGNTLEDVEDLQEDLFNNDWIEYAKQIPLEYLDPSEKEYIIKYINKEPLNPMDKEIINDLLNKYRPVIKKVKPKEVLENIEYNKLIIEDEKKFLELVDEFNEIQVIYFTCYIGNQEIKMKLDLYPLEDSKAITDITDNLSFLKDLSQDELILYNKIENNDPLTREEILVRADLQNKIEKATLNNTRKTLIEYLALQLKFHGKDSSIADMREVFSKISNVYLSALFDEVQRRNHLNDINTDKLFQSFD